MGTIDEYLKGILGQILVSYKILTELSDNPNDLEIIKMIDFSRISPPVISYEHCNLSREDQFACRELLQSHGYGFATYHGDTVAVKTEFLPATLDRSMCQL